MMCSREKYTDCDGWNPFGVYAASRHDYRLCFWDGTPTNVWTTAAEIAFGGNN